jgi:GntR family transcriptional regulator
LEHPNFALEVMTAIETSKTHRLYLLLKDQIVSGNLAPNARLPSEPEIAARHQLSRVTVRRALDGLERDGLIRRQPGAGTFVRRAPRNHAVVADLSNMLAHLREMGRSTRVKLLSFGYELPSPSIATALRLSPDDRVQKSHRIRFVDDMPFSSLVTYVPERIGITYSERDLATTALLDLLERSGVVADRAHQTIAATLAGPEVAHDLDVEIGAPLLALTRTVLDRSGHGVEYLSALYRPDLYVFQMEMTRAGQGDDRHWNPIAHSSATAQSLHLRRRQSTQRRRS